MTTFNVVAFRSRPRRPAEGVLEISEPRDSEHGFTGFGFRDPEGNIWEVVWKHGSVVDDEGHLTFEP
jgi:hypothetical protein